MVRLGGFAKTNLDMQGFGTPDDEAQFRYTSLLRFTPGLGTVLIVIGLVLQSPSWLGSMAIVAFSGAALPSGMLIDLVYNLGVRHPFRSPALLSTPKPRQFSYFLSTTLLAGSALSFHYGLSLLGFILGGIAVTGGTILTTTLWCLGSWFYRLVLGHGGNIVEGLGWVGLPAAAIDRRSRTSVGSGWLSRAYQSASGVPHRSGAGFLSGAPLCLSRQTLDFGEGDNRC